MTSTPTDTAAQPDVAAFVADVRARLSDLGAEQRDDLLDGLEADLREQLADGSSEVLADPDAYGAELRVAAGLPAVAPRGRWRGHDPVGRSLDHLRARSADVAAGHPALRVAASALVAQRPAWWVLRAWVAVTLLDLWLGGYEAVTVLPTLGLPGLGLVAVLVASLVSAMIGQGRWWPGGGPARRGTARAVLLGLNLVAVVGFAYLAHQSTVDRYEAASRIQVAPPQRGIVVDGRAVRNIYPYDAHGQPITTGVQLFDGTGRPFALSAQQAQVGEWGSADRLVGCPWLNGSRRLLNVFPLPERAQKLGACDARLDERLGRGELPAPPLAQVPAVTRTP